MTAKAGLLSDQDVERITQTLGAIRLIRGFYGSSVEGQRLLQEALKMLKSSGDSLVCINIADAIEAANHMRRVQEVPAPAQSTAA
jgi:hypothetical protein